MLLLVVPMKVIKKNTKQSTYHQRNESERDSALSLKQSFSNFDESGTLGTFSTLSLSSSEDSCHEHLSISKSNSMKHHQSSNKPKNNRGRKYSGNQRGTVKGKPKFVSRISPKATSTKKHDAPMQRRDIYFALDCEMVGVGPEAVDSALARVSIVNWDNEIVLDTYVKVDEPVTDYRTFISGITPEQIQSESALPINEVRKMVMSTLQGKILIGHGLENDLKVVGINHPWCDVRDTAKYAPFMKTLESRSAEEQKKLLCPRKLRDLVLEKLGKHIQVMGKAHSPVEDAIAAMDLYKAVRSEWEMEMMKKVNQANQANQVKETRMPFNARVPRKVTIAEIGSMPLFPATQYPAPPMSYVPFQLHYCNQPANHQVNNARLAQEYAARSYSSAFAYHQEMMLRC